MVVLGVAWQPGKRNNARGLGFLLPDAFGLPGGEGGIISDCCCSGSACAAAADAARGGEEDDVPPVDAAVAGHDDAGDT